MNVLPLYDGEKFWYLPIPEGKESLSVQELTKLCREYKEKRKPKGEEFYDGITSTPGWNFWCKCGRHLEVDWRYCPYCGHQLWQDKEEDKIES